MIKRLLFTSDNLRTRKLVAYICISSDMLLFQSPAPQFKDSPPPGLYYAKEVITESHYGEIPVYRMRPTS